MPKSRFLVAAVALAGVIAGGLVAASSNDDASAAIGGITWQDEFNCAGRHPARPSRSGSSTSAAAAGATTSWSTTPTRPATSCTTAPGNLAITARRENPNNYQCHYGRCQYTSAAS